jgi:hypothetical protein
MPAGLLELAGWQAGLVTRGQALKAGLTSNAIASKVTHARWTQVHRGVYATFTGQLTREAQLWAAVLYAGPGARLSHETAAEIIRLADRESPLIHVAIPGNRRVRPPQGVAIHLSSGGNPGWRFARGVPPHTFAEETVIDLANAATNLDDVIAYVTAAFARDLTSEERLRQEAARASVFAGAPISARSSPGRRTARTQYWSTATTATWSRRTGSPWPASRRGSPSPTAAAAAATATTRSTA